MRLAVRIALVPIAVALLVTVTACAGQTPPSLREEPLAPATPASASEGGAAATTPTVSNGSGNAPAVEPTLTAGRYASSVASAGVAVGGELQHTDQWVLGGRVWAMTIDGQPDNVTNQPKVQVVAVNANGAATVIAEVPAADAKGASSIQGGIQVPVPPSTVRIQIRTTLHAAKGGGDAPVLDIPLTSVPTVKQLPPQP